MKLQKSRIGHDSNDDELLVSVRSHDADADIGNIINISRKSSTVRSDKLYDYFVTWFMQKMSSYGHSN